MVDSTGLEPVLRISGPVFACFAVLFCAGDALCCAIRWPVSFSRAFAVRLKIRLKSTARQMHCSDGFSMQELQTHV